MARKKPIRKGGYDPETPAERKLRLQQERSNRQKSTLKDFVETAKIMIGAGGTTYTGSDNSNKLRNPDKPDRPAYQKSNKRGSDKKTVPPRNRNKKYTMGSSGRANRRRTR